MTIQGVTEKAALTFLLLVASGMSIWGLALTGNPELAALVMTLGFAVNGIFYIVLLLSWFVPSLRNLFSNPVFVLGYASAQGFLLGGTTFMIENSMGSAYSGISIQAFLITAMIFGGMLGIYRSGLINVNDNFRIALSSAVVAVVMIYLFSFILGFAGIEVPYIHGNGVIGIGFSVLVIGIGAMMLAADFDFVERGVENGAPKEMEWRAVFGLLVTLIWLYIEILRLHNVYGSPAELDPSKSQVIPALCRKTIEQKNQELLVWGSGKQKRAFVHVEDIVDGFIKAINKKNKFAGAIQLGPNYSTSIAEIAERIVLLSGKKIQIKFDKSRPEGDFDRMANNSRAKKYLNWTPVIGLDEGLKKVYNWCEKKLL